MRLLTILIVASTPIFGIMTKATATEEGRPTSLELYYAPYCPHSLRIIEYVNAQKIKLKLVNVADNDAAKKILGERGGRMMVPCLFIDGKPLYHDDEIIQWFQNNRECLDLSAQEKPKV